MGFCYTGTLFAFGEEGIVTFFSKYRSSGCRKNKTSLEIQNLIFFSKISTKNPCLASRSDVLGTHMLNRKPFKQSLSKTYVQFKATPKMPNEAHTPKNTHSRPLPSLLPNFTPFWFPKWLVTIDSKSLWIEKKGRSPSQKKRLPVLRRHHIQTGLAALFSMPSANWLRLGFSLPLRLPQGSGSKHLEASCWWTTLDFGRPPLGARASQRLDR